MNAKNLQENDQYDIPLDLSDIMTICNEYNKLGWQIQNQLQVMLDLGMQEAINTNQVKRESLPFIKHFLIAINNNPYFGDSADQAKEFINIIKQYEYENPIKQQLTLN